MMSSIMTSNLVHKDLIETDGLRVLQINLQKSRTPTAELNTWSFDIALVQEPNVGKTGLMPLIMAPLRSFHVGRARAAVITRGINYWPVGELSTKDLAVVALEPKGNLSHLYVASGYFDITEVAPPMEADKLVAYCNNKKIPLILGVDTNAHSPWWGELDSNPRGVKLEDWINSKGLFVQNMGSTPTFCPDNGKRSTILDVTITNRYAAGLLSNWKVIVSTPSLSDHRLITYNVAAEAVPIEREIRLLRKTKWGDFQGKLKNTVAMDASDNAQELAYHLMDNLTAALDAVAPKKILKQKDDGRKWWTESMTSKRRALRNLYNKRLINNRVKEKYTALKNELSYEIGVAKANSWKEFCSKAESPKDISRILRILENPPDRQMNLLKESGVLLNPQESLEYLLRTHFPDGVVCTERETAVNAAGDDDDDPDHTGICQFITPQKVKAALNSFGDYKAAGPDELPPIALKNLDNNYINAITVLYQLSLATGMIPLCWQQMKVVFIPKMGKSDYAQAKSYRPITLSNFLLKGLERLVQWYIVDFVVTRPLYSQHAYTKGRSCDTALSTFVNEIEKAIFNGQYLLAVSLDCSGAFDCIKFDSAEVAMVNHGIPSNICRWYCKLLRNRIISAEMQGQKAWIRPARGSPQGGVLSPLIWNLIMDSFLSQYKKGPVKVLGYADDILLYCAGNDPTVLSELIQPVLDDVALWGLKNGLSFNPAKTGVVLYHHKKGNPPEIPLYLKGEELDTQNSLKYLGVEIDRGLTWNLHVKDRSNKCKFLMNKCKNLIHKTWGLCPQKMEWIHHAVIRPKLTYGAVIWSSSLSETNKKRLTAVQRLMMLSITQPLRSAPTVGLEVMMGWLPMYLHCEEMGLQTYSRTQEVLPANWDGLGKKNRIVGHIQYWKKKLNQIIHINYPTDPRINVQIWTEVNTNTDDASFERSLDIFTDASKSMDEVGYAWMASDGDFIIDERIYSAREISVYEAEVMAIKEALSWLKDHNILGRRVNIYSDSQSAVISINGHVATNGLLKDTMMSLCALKQSHPVEVKWVKGHNNNTGNEYADMLARLGAEEAKQLAFASPFKDRT